MPGRQRSRDRAGLKPAISPAVRGGLKQGAVDWVLRWECGAALLKCWCSVLPEWGLRVWLPNKLLSSADASVSLMTCWVARPERGAKPFAPELTLGKLTWFPWRTPCLARPCPWGRCLRILGSWVSALLCWLGGCLEISLFPTYPARSSSKLPLCLGVVSDTCKPRSHFVGKPF